MPKPERTFLKESGFLFWFHKAERDAPKAGEARRLTFVMRHGVEEAEHKQRMVIIIWAVQGVVDHI